jgi:hypothetical protein
MRCRACDSNIELRNSDPSLELCNKCYSGVQKAIDELMNGDEDGQ